jgi:hypothetical protein
MSDIYDRLLSRSRDALDLRYDPKSQLSITPSGAIAHKDEETIRVRAKSVGQSEE